MTEATQIQAPIGGELHKLSDKFYKGGQFMPDQDKLAGSKKIARKAAGKIGGFTNPVIGKPAIVGGKIPVSVLPYNWNRHKIAAWAATEDAAVAMRNEFRKMIEERLNCTIDWSLDD